jgi:hypothetical protein
VGDVSHCLASASATMKASMSFPSGHSALAFVGRAISSWAVLRLLKLSHISDAYIAMQSLVVYSHARIKEKTLLSAQWQPGSKCKCLIFSQEVRIFHWLYAMFSAPTRQPCLGWKHIARDTSSGRSFTFNARVRIRGQQRNPWSLALNRFVNKLIQWCLC